VSAAGEPLSDWLPGRRAWNAVELAVERAQQPAAA
jgi:hypothetical protein